MHIRTTGIVLRETPFSEDNRYITVLTRDRGVISVLCRRVRRLQSRFAGATSLLCYSDFTLYAKKDSYTLDDAEVLDSFVPLRDDIVKLALASYFCELTMKLADVAETGDESLKLFLNSLYLLGHEKRPMALIKAVFELRLLAISGYMPDLVGCHRCGRYEDALYFDPLAGNLECEGCRTGGELLPLSPSVLLAMRHICYTEAEKVFNFTLPDDELARLASITERFTLVHTERRLPTLDFYHSVRG